ncbi:MAG: PQQ-binding-like beta-propeller repeat protein [Muribaculaceae bacterium]|nr:PQQ-binding-like beta-propeller repeat protein [Muribaculaceae bacterium]
MRHIFKFLSAAAFSLLLFSCHNGGNSSGNDSIEEEDSTALARQELLKEPSRLPDTIYESAKSIDFKVQINDSTLPGNLNTLRDLYTDVPGAFTFRKGARRQADFGGVVSKAPTGIRVDWTFKTAENYSETQFGQWGGGSGWSGEPVYVEWPDSILSKMRANNAVYPDFSGKEIIVGSLCGNLYFIDFVSGKPSRPDIPGKNPLKGSVSLDPSLNGNLYVGQGVPVERPFGVFLVDLFTNKKDLFLPEDPKALRRWGAFDSSSVRAGQFQFFPAENGAVYKYLAEPGRMTQHSVLRYKINGAAPGIESSMAVYANYGVVCDNHGNIIAINLDTMNPVWLYKLGDDTDCTPLIVEEEGEPYLYVGCEIDRQGASGTANFVKLNLKDGSEVWISKLPGKQFTIANKHFDGGYYASPLLGRGDCEGMLFDFCVRNDERQNGELIAFDRKTGKILYQTKLKHYAWSSPVSFLDPDGKMYIVGGDCIGNMYIFDASNGNILFTERIGNNFESSPVVVGNSLVVGTRGNSIFKLTIE